MNPLSRPRSARLTSASALSGTTTVRASTWALRNNSVYRQFLSLASVTRMLIPASLKSLKPGEITLVVLGRVVMGDIAVTLVDLAQRDLLRIEETDNGADWLLTPSHGVSARRAIAEYEAKLLESLADRGHAVLLSSLAAGLGQDLGKVRRALEHEGVAQGWIRRLRHDQRTPKGEELARRVRAFQRELRKFKADRGEDAVSSALLPFALRFGLVSGERLPFARFAHDWVRTFGDLPGWRPVQPDRPVYDTYGPMFPEIRTPYM